ncbi:glucose/sorbosone dehydrogenase [Thiocapsa rosea]|uniref:Glucose/sorbosone dehydrogenase n=1 Tax=Thiocapsa rosea TaxID=69360 RepID=A0A495VGA1_9GAMM|nr:glucose/sorbosone dehydrogenase [Thiocapsa rosea]
MGLGIAVLTSWVLTFFPINVAEAQPYGLDPSLTRSVGPFIDGVFPPLTPGSGSTYRVAPAFPNISQPNTLVVAPNPADRTPGLDRLYVGSRAGIVTSFPNRSNATPQEVKPFLDLTDRVATVWDGGFLGMVFHPEFGNPSSPYEKTFYAYYSAYCPPTALGDTIDFSRCNPAYPQGSDARGFFNTWLRLSRFQAEWDSTSGTWRGLKDSESPMLNIRLYNFTHRGGGLTFGNDGYLYLTIGDQRRWETAQDIVNTLEGGVLRLAVDIVQTGPQSWTCPPQSHTPRRRFQDAFSNSDEMSGRFYCIPDDNPWLSEQGAIFEEYFSIGHRSPHRLALDPVTGDLWSGEVGESTREEINVIRRGGNYGWPFREGMVAGPRAQPASYLGQLTDPVIDFNRTEAKAVIGGYVYRGTRFPELAGKFIAGDYITRNLWAITLDRNRMTATKAPIGTFDPGALSTFGQDNQGEVFLGSVASNIPLQQLTRADPGRPEPPPYLSDTGAFVDLTSREIHPAGIPYDLVPFWSDGAMKQRWVFLPDENGNGLFDVAGERIEFSETGNWGFPIGTVLVKHFELPLEEGDADSAIPIETRFLVLGEDNEWYGITYSWREDLSDADLLLNAETREFSVLTPDGVRDQTWLYPSRDACLLCHNPGAGGALGLRTHQLNRDLLYPSTGRTDNQLRTWNHLGIFTPALKESDIRGYLAGARLDELTASVEHRARSWLDTNYSYCHRPETGNRATFDTRLTTPLAQSGLIWGGVSDDLGISGAYLIHPGDPEGSIAHVRAREVGTAYAMPPLAKDLPDSAGLAVLEDWIQTIDAGSGQLAPTLTSQSGTANLSTEGSGDWVHWGRLTSAASVTAKSGVTAQIPRTLGVIGGSALRFNDTGPRLRYAWTDGTPTASATTGAGLYIGGLGKGYTLTVPADTDARTLVVYLGGYKTRGRIEVTLSDGSVAPYVQTVEDLATAFDRRLAVTYRAAGPGQTLTLRYLQDRSGGNVTFQAAALQGATSPPPVNQAPVVASIADRTVQVGTALSVGVNASDPDGPVPLALAAAPLPGTATFTDNGSGSGTLRWTPTASDVAGSPYNITVRATDGGGRTGSASFSVTVLPADPGDAQLDPLLTVPSGTANLSTEGSGDWVHWGLISAASVTAKAGVTAQIPRTLGVIGGSALRFNDTGPRLRYAWTDGTPTASATTGAGLYIGGLGKGYTLTVPADTDARTLVVYLGGYKTRGRIEVTLSDGSVAPYVQTVEDLATAFDRRLAVTYRAAGPGQTLTLRYLQDRSGGNVTFQAAALQGATSPPPVNQAPVVASIADRTVQVGTALSVGVNASDPDGPVPLALAAAPLPGTATFTDNGSGSGTLRWTPTASDVAGSPYNITVRATDGGGRTGSASFSVTVLPADPGDAQLDPLLTVPSGTANLSTEGSGDWVHWGLISAASVTAKAGVTAQIPRTLGVIGGSALRFNDTGPRLRYAWTDGTPTASATTGAGLYIGGLGKGYTLTVPADTDARTLVVYLGGYKTRGRIEVTLSDGSVAPYVQTVEDLATAFDRRLAVTYRAAGPGQTLTLRYLQDRSGGNVTFQAAALQGATSPPPPEPIGLVGHWTFDEGAGSAAQDSSGNGNDGILINSTWGTGRYGQAVALSGNNDSHVSVPGSSTLNAFTDQITISAWAFPTQPISGFVAVVNRQIGTIAHPDQFYLGFGPQNGIMRYKWEIGTTSGEGNIYRGSPDSNRWIHLAGTYNGSTMRLYVDGVEIGSVPMTGTIRVDDNPITIGAEENGSVLYDVVGTFAGLIDEVRVYDRALSASQVDTLFRYGSASVTARD